MSTSGAGPGTNDYDQALSTSLRFPSVARIYDYHLGGGYHWAIDRVHAEEQLKQMPNIPVAMRANRAFLGRAVRYAVRQGIRQFVDIGSGLPTVGQVHQVAENEAPGQCSVVYIDNEPVAHAHAEILLGRGADPDRTRAICEDYFNYEQLWSQVLSSGIIDPTEPVCLLVVAILHFMLPETEPETPMAFYRDQLAPGSIQVLSHACDELNDDGIQQVVSDYSKTTNSAHLRSRSEFAEFFGDFDVVAPGIVWAPEWGPAPDLAEWDNELAWSRYLAGVAHKTAATVASRGS